MGFLLTIILLFFKLKFPILIASIVIHVAYIREMKNERNDTFCSFFSFQ